MRPHSHPKISGFTSADTFLATEPICAAGERGEKPGGGALVLIAAEQKSEMYGGPEGSADSDSTPQLLTHRTFLGDDPVSTLVNLGGGN